MPVAEAVEQVLMSVGAVAPAVAMELRKQGGVALRDFVRLAHRALEKRGLER